MRIKTHANALVIEGTLDTPGNKKVWKALGDEALPLARDVYKSRPGDYNPRSLTRTRTLTSHGSSPCRNSHRVHA